MKTKRSLSLLAFAVLLFALQIVAVAAEDTIDEAEIYLNEQAYVSTQTEREKIEGIKTSDISNSPALAVEDRVEIIRIYEEDSREENSLESTDILHSPSTGISSYMLPIGTVLMVLSFIPVLYRNKK